MALGPKWKTWFSRGGILRGFMGDIGMGMWVDDA